ncbi:MAG: conserved hypothetical rane protein [Neobacillus sp.]|nr:conserved hypothetical rane protein [Neobacillus sp.]
MRKIRLSLVDDTLKAAMKDMEYTQKQVKQFTRKRILLTFLAFFVGVLLGLLYKSFSLLMFAPLIALAVWFLNRHQVLLKHKYLKVKRQVEFDRMMTLAISELLQKETTMSIVFQRIYDNLPSGPLKDSLSLFLIGLIKRPFSIKPFEEFAERASGTDSASNLLHTLYDFQQNANDTDVIYELGHENRVTVFNVIDDVIQLKLDKFIGIITSSGALVMIPLMTYLVLMMLDMWKGLHF